MPLPPPSRRRHRVSYETRIVLKAALCVAPALAVTVVLLLTRDANWEVWLTAITVIFLPFPFLAWGLQHWITHPLRVAANVLGAIREGDYTLRSRRESESSGIITELYQEINAIATVMERARFGGMETRAVIDKITENIDIATLIVDANRRVAQANDAARRLIASINQWDADPIGQTVDQLSIAFCLDSSRGDFSRFSYLHADRRFEGRRGLFRMEGERYDLIALTDITRAASEHERESWKRLLRVLGHELNNSIAPIKSLSSTLTKIVQNTKMEEESKTDIIESLEAISSRSDSIIRFMRDYTSLARLPEPSPELIDLAPLLRKACQLYPGIVTLDDGGSSVAVFADSAQLQQSLINLLKNAVEATEARPESVACRYAADASEATIEIIDNGPGVLNPDNLFVPFYTTKENGSGIGLAISRQIVEAVGGRLTLSNRGDAHGCVARIRLPLAP